MLKKLSLDQTKTYEKCLASEEISKMLVAFVHGRQHHLAIGAEQGDIDKWDDLVIRNSVGGCIYIQVKRQTTPFSIDSITRDTYTQGKRQGLLRDLSQLDETLKSLGKRISKSSSNDLRNEFWLELPEGSIQIKKNLEIRHLRTLCEIQITSVTTPNDLIALASINPNANNIYLWLTTWCDFIDWEHILKALRFLKIRNSGFEADINDRVKNNLSHIFKTTELERVHMLILSYLEKNATFAGAIRPRQLLHQLKDYLIPDISRWTLFKTDGSSWNISGIHDLEDNNEIERPSVIVPSLWAIGNPNVRSLRIHGDCPENCLVSESLMRLSLHPQGSFDILCSNKSSWKNSIKIKTGGTIGVAKDDLKDSRMLDGLELCSPSEPKEIITIDEMEELAQKLHYEMYMNTFKLVDSAILDKVRAMKKCELRNEVESRWISWKLLLEKSVDEQKELFSKILHPRAEGKSISGELRVGPKTVDLLSEAMYLLLVVSVCLGDEDNQTWKSVTDKLKMTSVGLAYWSGPADGAKKVIEIDDDEGFNKLLENEPEQIIIIPQSALTDLEAFKDDISGDISKSELLPYPNYPKLFITKDRNFIRKLRNGVISELRQYFQSSLDKYKDIREDAVNQVVR